MACAAPAACGDMGDCMFGACLLAKAPLVTVKGSVAAYKSINGCGDHPTTAVQDGNRPVVGEKTMLAFLKDWGHSPERQSSRSVSTSACGSPDGT